MAWKEYFHDAEELVTVLNARLAKENSAIRYVNLRYKLYQQAESKWLYDAKVSIACGEVMIESGQQTLALPQDLLEYLKVRPFYYQACVGFKEMVLYAHKID